MRFKAESLAIVILAFGNTFSAFAPTQGFSQTPYYQGKTITIFRGGEPGGQEICKRGPSSLS